MACSTPSRHVVYRRQVRANQVRRAPLIKPRPRQGERPPVTSPVQLKPRPREIRNRRSQLTYVMEEARIGERDVPDFIEADHAKMTATSPLPALSEGRSGCR